MVMAAFVCASYIYYIKFHDFGLLFAAAAAAVSVKSLSVAAAAFAVATEEV